MPKPSTKPGIPSANWLALQKELKPRASKGATGASPSKRRKLQHSPAPSSSNPFLDIKAPSTQEETSPVGVSHKDVKNGESLSSLRKMIHGHIDCTEARQQPGKYLALDCEMVGVGLDGSESSLARVSMVNYYGVVIMDEFVRQRERVVDYRTQFSGIRESDMIKAKSFDEIQKKVAELLKDRILIGHAVHNDLKALLLSHPRPQTRDTQIYAGKFKVVKSRYVALRNLVKQELNTIIQGGEHSSVTDARATMAVYRLHRKEWEIHYKQPPTTTLKSQKRKRMKDGEGSSDGEESSEEKPKEVFPGGGRKGISSGLSTVVRHGKSRTSGGSGKKWWKELLSEGAKGSISV